MSFCKGADKSPGPGKVVEPTKIRTKTLNLVEDLQAVSSNTPFLPPVLSGDSVILQCLWIFFSCRI